MNRKAHNLTLGLRAATAIESAAGSFQPFSKANQAELAANVELTIWDLPGWKDLVHRVGLKAARQILQRGLLLQQFTDSNPRN